jgi:hypothetical protein
MNDVQMMLGKRAAEYYLFLTWCITAPLLTLVSAYDILRSNPEENDAIACILITQLKTEMHGKLNKLTSHFIL